MTSGGNSGSGGNRGVSLLGKIIIGAIPVLALAIAFGQWWTGDTLLCKLNGIKVNFIKCPDETKPANTPETKTDKNLDETKPTNTPETKTDKNLPEPQTPQKTSTPIISTPDPIPTPTQIPNNPIIPEPVKNHPSSSTTKFDIGVLNGNQEYQDRVSYQIQEKYYFFSIDRNSNVKLYLDGVTSEVWMGLYVDTNGNGDIDNNERLDSDRAYSSGVGVISQNLAADRYIVLVKFQNQKSDYTLQLVNQTSLTKNIGLLQDNKTDRDFLNRDKRVQYYQFKLSETKNVRLSLSDVTSKVWMGLYVDTNGNGVIDSNERLDSESAYSSHVGEIRIDLAPDNYFIVISKQQQNTEYTLNLFVQ